MAAHDTDKLEGWHEARSATICNRDSSFTKTETKQNLKRFVKCYGPIVHLHKYTCISSSEVQNAWNYFVKVLPYHTKQLSKASNLNDQHLSTQSTHKQLNKHENISLSKSLETVAEAEAPACCIFPCTPSHTLLTITGACLGTKRSWGALNTLPHPP